MAHAEINENLTPEEKLFNEYFQRAEDFRKIEIFRYSKYWYEQALTFNIRKKEVEERLEMVDGLIRNEVKWIIIVAVIAALSVGGWFLFG